MVVFNERDQASFETTKRLLAELINEGLCHAGIEISREGRRRIFLRCRSRSHDDTPLSVTLRDDTIIEMKDNHIISVVRPDCLQPPVMLHSTDTETCDPEILLKHMSSWFTSDINDTLLNEIGRELSHCTRNQEKWLQIASQGPTQMTLNDASICWERTLVYGHPTHPYHRLCYAQAPLKPVQPDDIPGMLTPTLAFVSVFRTDVRITGSFEQILRPLLSKLDVHEERSDRVVVPCLAQQLPSIREKFVNATVLKLVSDCADAQASLRTLTLRPWLDFGYHMKLSLACRITSALRTITPWTTIGGPTISKILDRFLPEDLWVFKEVASITGSQTDFDVAKHMSCILRDSLESRAEANGERLVIAAALGQKPHNLGTTYAEMLFSLNSTRLKQEWFQSYITLLFELVLHPLVKYGIGLEAHGQNFVARICRQTGRIKGFAVRDFGGIRLHVPTLESVGVDFHTLPPGGAIMTSNLHDVWSKVHHSLFQNHVGLLLTALGLDNAGGWPITLQVLSNVLNPDGNTDARSLFAYFTRDTMPFKCFLRMRMEGKYRDYIEREVPNMLLVNSPRWGSVITTYQPSLHYT